MYYNSKRTSNDYYNSYKREIAELHAYRKEEAMHKTIKWILTIVTLIIFILGGIFLYDHFNPKIEKDLPNIVINENELPQSIQLRESKTQTEEYLQANATDTYQNYKKRTPVLIREEPKSLVNNINEKDIALIVQIIMSQMNTKKELPLEMALEEAENKIYVNKALKESNHFNKVILTKAKVAQVQNASLVELSNRLDAIINETETSDSNYETQLKEEIIFREQEMRYIVVQKGDTLSKIAQRAYGNSDAYPRIFSANPEVLKNPNNIFVGQRLRIPS
jgi:LysM repeat protein